MSASSFLLYDKYTYVNIYIYIYIYMPVLMPLFFSFPFFRGPWWGIAVLQQECIGVVYINNKNNNNKTVLETSIPDSSFVVFL